MAFIDLRRCAPAAVAVAALLIWPASARAHLTDTGLGPVYDGIAHLLLSFDDLLPVVALALLAGLNGAGAGRVVLFALPAVWLACGMVAAVVAGPAPPAAVTSLSMVALGLLTAVSVRLAQPAVMAIALALGLMHGWLNGAAIAAAGREAIGLVGIAGTIFVIVALTSALVVSLKVPWARIAVRVAGSWVAASGLLTLGWALRTG